MRALSRTRPEEPDPSAGAGRGGLALTAAKAWFILLGLVQQIVLPRVLGLDGYGRLSSVLSAASIAYNPIVTTSIQGVSRATAQADPEARPATLRRVLGVHAVLAALAAAGFFLAAPSLAGFVRAPHLTGGFRVASLVLLSYGLYAPLVGALNGARRFLAQAGFDGVLALLRTIALAAGGCLLAGRGLGVEGAMGGFVAVAALLTGVAFWVVGIGRPGPGAPSRRAHVAFVAPLLGGQILLNLLFQADLTLLRRFAGAAAAAGGLPPEAADPLVGAYRATQLFSFLPYQLLVSVTFILFPMVAASHRAGDRAATAGYVRTGMRVAALLSGLVIGVTSGLAGPLLRMVYGAQAAELGARSLELLALGFGAFALFGLLTAVLTSVGREQLAMGVTGIAVVLVGALASFYASAAPFGEELLLRTARSTSLGVLVATALAALAVRRHAGGVLEPRVALRVGGSLALAVAAGRSLAPTGAVATLGAAVAVGGAYVTALVASGELGRDDAAALARIIGRRA